jgi:phosphatidate cytidylyltransferase
VLIQRITSALVLIPVVLFVTWLGGPWFVCLVTLLALRATWEFYELVRKDGHRPTDLAGLALVVAFMLDACFPRQGIAVFGLVSILMALMIRQVFRKDFAGFVTNWALTLTGALYVGGLFSYLVALRSFSHGMEWIFLTCAVTWASDSAAYFVGSRWGRHGFFTHVSPHKTWEGAIAGFIGGIITTVIAGRFIHLALWQSLLMGAVMVVGLTLGDLCESVVKRQVGVKDSSDLIPGHGGMLDRVDSILFAGVIAYYFAVVFAR